MITFAGAHFDFRINCSSRARARKGIFLFFCAQTAHMGERRKSYLGCSLLFFNYYLAFRLSKYVFNYMLKEKIIKS